MAGIRDMLNENPTAFAVVLCAMIGGAILFLATRKDPSVIEYSGMDYFYDIESKEYFLDSELKIPPFKRENGHTAVRAAFFACGPCTLKLKSDGGTRYFGFLERYEADTATRLKSGNRVGVDLVNTLEVSTDGENWVSATSPEGVKLIAAATAECPSEDLNRCHP